MNDSDRDFYDAAMAEAETFVSAGHFGSSPQPPISEADRKRVAEGWADRAFYNIVNDESGMKPAVGPISPLNGAYRQETVLLVDDNEVLRQK